MKALTKRQQAELDALADKDGTLKPETVVEFARDPETALHSRFQWDDSKAAQAYRLDQARQVIRCRIFTDERTKHPVRMFVSLEGDRGDAGYRDIRSIMESSDLRAMLLEQALAELQLFRLKYQHLSELAAVFEAADEVAASKGKKRARRSA